jgi:hypothetical protein
VPFRFEVQINYNQAGLREVYYSSATDLDAALKQVDILVGARAKILYQFDGIAIYGVRVSEVGAPGNSEFVPQGINGQFKSSISALPGTTELVPGPWNAALIQARGGAGVKRTMEMRVIPPDVLQAWVSPGAVRVGTWFQACQKFFAAIGGTVGFGILHKPRPLPANLKTVQTIVPNQTLLTIPLGVLVVTVPGGHGIPAGTSANVRLVNVRTIPALRSVHVGVYIDANTFYLKNTDVGTLVYQPGSGTMYVQTQAVSGFTRVTFIRSGFRKSGRAFGAPKGRNLHKV